MRKLRSPIFRNTPRVPQPGDDVRIVWGRAQIEHMEVRIDEETGEAREIDRVTFTEAWRDPDRTDVEVQDLERIMRVQSEASVRDRGEITIVWFFPKHDPTVIIPRTGFWQRQPPTTEPGSMLEKGRKQRRSRKEEGQRRKRGSRRHEQEEEEHDV